MANIPGYSGYDSWNDEASAMADFKATGGKGKETPGSGGGDLPSAPSILDFTEKAYAGSDNALKEYVMAMRGQRNPLDVYSELETAAGLPQKRATASTLREQVGSLEDTIRRVEGNVNATTTESYVTEGQRAGMIEARRKPMIEDLSYLATGLGRVEQGIAADMQGLDTKTNLFLKGQENELKPYELQYTAENDRAARLVTGFTADAQNNLQIMMAKWNRQNQLDDREVDQAFELLKMEKGFQQEFDKMQEQSKMSLDEYIAKQPIDLSTYEKQKQIDQKYKTSSGGGVVDTSSYYGGSSGNSSYYGTNQSTKSNTISNLWLSSPQESSSAQVRK